ncbi:MAG: thioredoxin family protein [Gammaproteobacteria bacterium]|nr:thioredoxin family protein [Gammaproteobacteria bacterium]
MLLSSDCSHCPAVLNTLCDLLKAGNISQLNVINLSQQPEAAQPLQVRSVPWVKIGEIELSGQHNKAELLHAIELAQSGSGLMQHYDELLNNGQLQEAIHQLHKQPHNLSLLSRMMQTEDIKISVQIGIGAIMEEFARSEALNLLIPELTQLTQHPLARVRNDACFYLCLTANPDVRPSIALLLNDEDKAVQETARDCLDELDQTHR